mgnify:FL=1
MKTKLLVLLFLALPVSFFAQNITLSPEPFSEDQNITITASNVSWTSGVYLWTWHYNSSGTQINNPEAIGTDFGNSPESARFTNNGDGTYSYVLKPTEFYKNTGISRIGLLVKNQNGSQQSTDLIKSVGAFDVTLTAPTTTSSSFASGSDLNIVATSTITADFRLFANGNLLNSANSTKNYTYTANPTLNTNYRLEVAQTETSNLVVRSFTTLVKPVPQALPMPKGMKDGFNYDKSNPNEATLVFYAPRKEFIHLIGNFNESNWTVDSKYLMNYDDTADRHWITIDLTNTPKEHLLYQYVVEYNLRVADPYSTLILDEFNDQFIKTSTFENIPAYPSGKTSEAISYIQPNEEDYQWQITDFKPAKREDLVIYEVLIRDFDTEQNFQSVIDRLDYLSELGINVLELMPVQEFDGNSSWGYNPSFHMALDKYYGTRNGFKALIDAAHAKGIAVIIDVVYNHASGQNPYYRMYNTSNGGTGGQPSADSPFFNQTATHSYSVFNDFNHSKTATKNYVKRTASYWIEEFKVDGFRWDLTKGFTQNCTAADESCTNAYQQDRVDVLKEYADMQWELDSDFMIIFEHLGTLSEEKQWADYRLNEGKGIMLWNKHTNAYNQSTMGYASDSNFDAASYKVKGFDNPAAVTYMESHDEERLMYKNIAFGNSTTSYNTKDLNTALARMEAAGAVFFTIPGPKMIWQFGELGYDISIFTCEDGSNPGDDSCKLSPKPTGWNYLSTDARIKLRNTWAAMIALKKQLPIFETTDFTVETGNTDLVKKIHLSNKNATEGEVNYVTVLANLSMTSQDINPQFQETGTWYNLMNNEEYEVTATTTPIRLEAGEYRIFGNTNATLSTSNENFANQIALFPNPASSYFKLSQDVDDLHIYTTDGALVKSIDFKNLKNKQVPIDDLTSGIYLVETIRGEFKQTLKLIVN